MNKADLVEEVSTETGLTKGASERVVRATTDAITDALARGEEVTRLDLELSGWSPGRRGQEGILRREGLFRYQLGRSPSLDRVRI